MGAPERLPIRFYISALISRGRLNSNLRSTCTPITAAEIKSALDRYAEFSSAFDRARAERYSLTYVLTSSNENIDFSNLDKWYERDTSEKFEDFTLYRVKFRP